MADMTSTVLPDAPVPAPDDAGSRYRFTTFTASLLVPDMYFRGSDPGPGAEVPDFDLPTLDGARFASRDLGERPVLLVFGSRTCPITESAGPRLVRLHARYGDQVRFVLVNTREAHPGDRFGQPATMAEKLDHARVLRDHHGIPFEVAVDDLDGTVHRAFSPKPNSAYLVRPDGVIVYRAHWANDDAPLEVALRGLIATGRVAEGRSRALVAPLLRGVGHLPAVIAFAGRKVARDVWWAAPPLAILGGLTRLVPGAAIDRRGAIVAGGLLLLAAAVCLGVGLAW